MLRHAELVASARKDEGPISIGGMHQILMPAVYGVSVGAVIEWGVKTLAWPPKVSGTLQNSLSLAKAGNQGPPSEASLSLHCRDSIG